MDEKEAFKDMTKSLHKGAFTDWCIKHKHKGANKSCINHALKEAKKSKNVTLKKQAILARTFMIMRKKRKEK